MKLLLPIFFCLFSTAVFAQLTDKELKKRIETFTEKNKGTTYVPGVKVLRVEKDTSTKLQGFINGRRSPAGVYRLSQDGMPCLVPATSGIAAIPNAFPSVSVPFKTTIPNAYKDPLLQQPKISVK